MTDPKAFVVGKIKAIQYAAIGVILSEILTTLVVVYIPEAFSFWAGVLSLALFTPLFFVFLVTLTYGSVVISLRLAITIGGMVVANTSILIILFANTYRCLDFRDGRIGFRDAIYFSIVTWTTLGYGDITPLGVARAFAAAEALIGYLIMGVLVAALSAMSQRK